MLAFLGVMIGMGLASQTACNAHLRTYVLSPFLASLISFSIGTGLLLLAMALSGHTFALHGGMGQEPLWVWLGGVCGVSFLTVNILLFPKLGAVETTVLPLLGQIIMAMTIDHFGWLRADVVTFNPNRALGVAILLVGVYFAVVHADLKTENPSSTSQGAPWPWRILGLGAGILVGIQLAANAELGRLLDSQVHAAFVNFLVGTTTLVLLVALKDRSLQGLQGLRGQNPPPWTFFGGLLGAAYVLMNVYLVDATGTGRTVVAVLFGQVAASILIQSLGLFRSTPQPLNRVKILGLLLMILGVVLVQ